MSRYHHALLAVVVALGVSAVLAGNNCATGDDPRWFGQWVPEHPGDAGEPAPLADGGRIFDCSTVGQPDDPDASWSPDADSTWHRVAWPAPCQVEIADQPKRAVPKLNWVPCSHVQGCTQLEVAWGWRGPMPFSNPSGIRWAGGYRIGMSLSWSAVGPVFRDAIYEADGAPMVVWRDLQPNCSLWPPVLTPSRAWVEAVFFDPTTTAARSAAIDEPYATLATTSQLAPWVPVPAPYWAATDELLAVKTAGRASIVYDRVTGISTELSPETVGGYSVQIPQPSGASVFFLRFIADSHAEAWVWNRAGNTASALVQPPGRVVVDVKTDGQTIAWIEAAGADPSAPLYQDCQLWTSPFATSKAGVVATKRRALPPLGSANSAMGEGFLALSVPVPNKYGYHTLGEVYRLSDARHWSFHSAEDIRDVVRVDKDEVWYSGAHSVYRQRLDALGPGDPAP